MDARLIVAIVPHGDGEKFAEAARRAGAGGGTILMGRGTAPNSLLALLGLGDTSTDVLLAFVDGAAAASVRGAIAAAASGRKAHYGVVFSIEAIDFGRGETAAARGRQTMEEPKNASAPQSGGMRMIGLIVNKGYAEDAMAAARKAGAGGGTILNGRGTARPDDAKFFGIALVPEKELLVILAAADKADAVLAAVSALPCLSGKGSGIVFRLPVDDFETLGS